MDRNTFYDSLRYYQEHDINSLQHIGQNALYGQKRNNVKYYKREGEPGNYRYFYTKEEYDAYKKNPTEQIKTDNKSKKETKKESKNKFKNKSKYTAMEQANKINNAKMNKMYDKKFVDQIKDIVGVTVENCLSEYKNYLKDPDNYTTDTYIEDRLTELGEGGNVNLNLRPEISVKELIDAGWGEVDPKLDENSYATVYSSTYDNADGTEFYNFTPIIMDPKTGEFLGVMEPEEFKHYCWDVADGIRDDDKNLQIGGPFIGEDAAKRAEDAAIEIHELHEQQHVNKEKSK